VTVRDQRQPTPRGEFELNSNTYEYATMPRRERQAALDRREQILALPEPEREFRLTTSPGVDRPPRPPDLRESTPLRSLSGQTPLVAFNAHASQAFSSLLRDADRAADEFPAAHPDLVAVADLGLGRPTATWTYVVQDNPFGSPLERFLVGVGRRAVRALGPRTEPN